MKYGMIFQIKMVLKEDGYKELLISFYCNSTEKKLIIARWWYTFLIPALRR